MNEKIIFRNPIEDTTIAVVDKQETLFDTFLLLTDEQFLEVKKLLLKLQNLFVIFPLVLKN